MISINAGSNNLAEFIAIAVCPECRSSLSLSEDNKTIYCNLSPLHQFAINKYGFFEFAPKTYTDKYDDATYVNSYVVDAFGYCLINLSNTSIKVGIGQPEGLYKCVSQMILSTIIKQKLYGKDNVRLIDIGCGIGRCVADIAIALPNALAVGLDYSTEMIRLARDILLSEETITFDLTKLGFESPVIKGKGLRNVFLAQASAGRLPLKMFDAKSEVGFDVVVNSMLIDRMHTSADILSSIRLSTSILRTGGTYIFASPLNWITRETWEFFGKSRTQILDLLQKSDLHIEEAFDGLVYRELLDPHGTHLELPVLVARAIKL